MTFEVVTNPWLPSGWMMEIVYPAVSPVSPVSPASPALTWEGTAVAVQSMIKAIEGSGWEQGKLLSPNGLCMQGAFLYRDGLAAASRHPEEHLSPLGMRVAALLAGLIKESGHHFSMGRTCSSEDWVWVIDFNDTPGRKSDEVLAILRDARGIAMREAALEGGPSEPTPDYIPEFVLSGAGTDLLSVGA